MRELTNICGVSLRPRIMGVLKIVGCILFLGCSISISSTCLGQCYACGNLYEGSMCATCECETIPPTLNNVTKMGCENSALMFIASDFTDNFNSVCSNSLASIRILSLPSDGTLELSGEAVIAGQEIEAKDLDKLTFSPVTGWTGFTSLSWQGSDGTYSINAANVGIEVIDISRCPVASDITMVGLINTVISFSATDFTSSFVGAGGSSLKKIKITKLPGFGTLKLSGNDIVVNQEIAIRNLDGLTFIPDTDVMGRTYFGWQGFDGTVYSNTAKVDILLEVPDSSYCEKHSLGCYIVMPVVLGVAGVVTGVAMPLIMYKMKKGCFKNRD